MTAEFHKRFNIQVNLEEAQRRFVNRTHTLIFYDFLLRLPKHNRILLEIAATLGERYSPGVNVVDGYTKNDFHRTLRAIETFYLCITVEERKLVDKTVNKMLLESEANLSIRWHNGRFYPEGAPILDQKLVNDVLGWVQPEQFETVITPFQKGLEHLLNSEGKPELRTDVVTDVYEALEAFAKILTGNDKDLSANRELFLSKIKASEKYKQILKDYIDYANAFRHAAEIGRPRQAIPLKEAESFVYLTGLFIRLAMP